jgi:hypothetical protein
MGVPLASSSRHERPRLSIETMVTTRDPQETPNGSVFRSKSSKLLVAIEAEC